ncbi:MAG: 3-oxoacid CoA-transferase subunit B [Actinobacteria bacterium]|nr:3-oxoacid CoA-transferase subunit B [Actinomycetota bacterium]
MDKQEKRIIIAKRIAKELKDGDIVNLGIGLPTLVADFIPEGIDIMFQSENGFVGLGPVPYKGNEDYSLVNAGGQPVTIKSGGAFFDSATSFAIIRGGHLDTTVLGALEVDQKGDFSSWMIPGKLIPGMGGAMDLAVGAKRVIIAMEHLTKEGKPKILKKCTLPLTAKEEVDLIVTDMGVFSITTKGLLLIEISSGCTLDNIIAATDADLIISDKLIEMNY